MIDAWGGFRRLSAAQRPMVAVGLLLLTSGLAHIGVWAVLGGPWEGPIAWRKPILFGLSGAVTSFSLAWVLGALRPWRLDRPLAWAYSLAIGLEVGLISLQTWRGVPSHFNEATPLDAWIFHAMGWLITAVTAYVAWLTLRAMGPLAIRPAQRWAMRGGLALLLTGALIGFVIVAVAEAQLAAGGSSEIYGPAGVLKFPHGVPLHAIQWLAVGGWLMQHGRIGERWQIRLMSLAVAGHVALTVCSIVQTLAGRGRLDLTATTGTLFALGLLATALPFVVAAWGLTARGLARSGPTDQPANTPREGDLADTTGVTPARSRA